MIKAGSALFCFRKTVKSILNKGVKTPFDLTLKLSEQTTENGCHDFTLSRTQGLFLSLTVQFKQCCRKLVRHIYPSGFTSLGC